MACTQLNLGSPQLPTWKENVKLLQSCKYMLKLCDNLIHAYSILWLFYVLTLWTSCYIIRIIPYLHDFKKKKMSWYLTLICSPSDGSEWASQAWQVHFQDKNGIRCQMAYMYWALEHSASNNQSQEQTLSKHHQSRKLSMGVQSVYFLIRGHFKYQDEYDL